MVATQPQKAQGPGERGSQKTSKRLGSGGRKFESTESQPDSDSKETRSILTRPTITAKSRKGRALKVMVEPLKNVEVKASIANKDILEMGDTHGTEFFKQKLQASKALESMSQTSIPRQHPVYIDPNSYNGEFYRQQFEAQLSESRSSFGLHRTLNLKPQKPFAFAKRSALPAGGNLRPWTSTAPAEPRQANYYNQTLIAEYIAAGGLQRSREAPAGVAKHASRQAASALTSSKTAKKRARPSLLRTAGQHGGRSPLKSLGKLLQEQQIDETSFRREGAQSGKQPDSYGTATQMRSELSPSRRHLPSPVPQEGQVYWRPPPGTREAQAVAESLDHFWADPANQGLWRRDFATVVPDDHQAQHESVSRAQHSEAGYPRRSLKKRKKPAGRSKATATEHCSVSSFYTRQKLKEMKDVRRTGELWDRNDRASSKYGDLGRDPARASQIRAYLSRTIDSGPKANEPSFVLSGHGAVAAQGSLDSTAQTAPSHVLHQVASPTNSMLNTIEGRVQGRKFDAARDAASGKRNLETLTSTGARSKLRAGAATSSSKHARLPTAGSQQRKKSSAHHGRPLFPRSKQHPAEMLTKAIMLEAKMSDQLCQNQFHLKDNVVVPKADNAQKTDLSDEAKRLSLEKAIREVYNERHVAEVVPQEPWEKEDQLSETSVDKHRALEIIDQKVAVFDRRYSNSDAELEQQPGDEAHTSQSLAQNLSDRLDFLLSNFSLDSKEGAREEGDASLQILGQCRPIYRQIHQNFASHGYAKSPDFHKKHETMLRVNEQAWLKSRGKQRDTSAHLPEFNESGDNKVLLSHKDYVPIRLQGSHYNQIPKQDLELYIDKSREKTNLKLS